MDKQQIFKSALTEAILTVCRKHLEFQTHVRVEGVIGVTVDVDDVSFVHIDNVIPFEQSSGFSHSEVLPPRSNIVACDHVRPTPTKRTGVTTYKEKDMQMFPHSSSVAELKQQATMAPKIVCWKLPLPTFSSLTECGDNEPLAALDECTDGLTEDINKVAPQKRIYRKGKQSELRDGNSLASKMVVYELVDGPMPIEPARVDVSSRSNALLERKKPNQKKIAKSVTSTANMPVPAGKQAQNETAEASASTSYKKRKLQPIEYEQFEEETETTDDVAGKVKPAKNVKSQNIADEVFSKLDSVTSVSDVPVPLVDQAPVGIKVVNLGSKSSARNKKKKAAAQSEHEQLDDATEPPDNLMVEPILNIQPVNVVDGELLKPESVSGHGRRGKDERKAKTYRK